MSGDYSRRRFDKRQDFSAVLSQQGRVQLDSDWNELSEIHRRRLRAETVGTLGRAVVPTEDGQNKGAFEITLNAGALNIGPGRIYVDGLLAENHGSGDLGKGTVVFDTVLEEDKATQPVLYKDQPYLKNAEQVASLPTKGKYAAYLDVWQREVTSLESPALVESAVGVDTTTRMQTVWQVKWQLPGEGGTLSCDTPLPFQPSGGRLSSKAVGVQTDPNPCLVPPTGGYRGLENRLYHVEIHDGGATGPATFKWSRDNASMATAVTSISADRKILSVASVARDSVMRFADSDWIEITDDWLEFASQPGLPDAKKGAGVMARIKHVHGDLLTIELDDPLPAGVFTDALGNFIPGRNTRVRRWDQRGKVFDINGKLLIDLDITPSPGVIPVPAQGTSIVLEDGVQITFETANTDEYHVADYWNFVARTVDASVEELDRAPPRGVHHHFCQLGVIDLDAKTPPEDCRMFWPPDMGKSCDCTICVSAISHNTGTLTLQAAVNQVKGEGGGKICLGPGIYNISKTVVIAGAGAIEIAGHGLPTLQATLNLVSMPILLIEQSIDITVQDLSFAAGIWPDPKNPPLPGLELRNTFFIKIKRCTFIFGTNGQPISGRTLSPAIGLEGLVVDTDIRDNFFNNVAVGIGSTDLNLQFVRALSVEANQMICTRAGLDLSDRSEVVFSEIRFARNFVESPVGFKIFGTGLDMDVESNTFNITLARIASVGISTNISQTRIENNRIFGNSGNFLPGGLGGQGNPGGGISSNGIMLGTSGTAIYGTRVTGNQINNLTGIGIAITDGTLLLESIISQNQLMNLDNGGIVMLASGTSTSSAVDLNIYGNSLAFIAQTRDVNSLMIAIQLLSSINIVVTENIIENVGLNPGITASRIGIFGVLISGMRAAGNRIANIGPSGSVSFSGGVVGLSLSHRIDIVDNEVRRSNTPPPGGDASLCSALVIDSTGDVSVRGNLLECFGSFSTVSVVTGGSCIFNENQCFFDNPGPNLMPIVKIQGNPVIASSNYVKGPIDPLGGSPNIGMHIDSPNNFSVIGNIVMGRISVNAAITLPLANQIPQSEQPLNVIT